MSIRDVVDRHPVVWVMGLVVAAFSAGIGAYEVGLRVAGRDTISVEQVADCRDAKDEVKELNEEVRKLNAEVAAIAPLMKARIRYSATANDYCTSQWVNCGENKVAYRQDNHWRSMTPPEKFACAVWCD